MALSPLCLLFAVVPWVAAVPQEYGLPGAPAPVAAAPFAAAQAPYAPPAQGQFLSDFTSHQPRARALQSNYYRQNLQASPSFTQNYQRTSFTPNYQRNSFTPSFQRNAFTTANFQSDFATPRFQGINPAIIRDEATLELLPPKQHVVGTKFPRVPAGRGYRFPVSQLLNTTPPPNLIA